MILTDEEFDHVRDCVMNALGKPGIDAEFIEIPIEIIKKVLQHETAERKMPNRALLVSQKKSVVLRLLAAWEKVPSWRLGQLISNAIHPYISERGGLFYVEDERLATLIEETISR